MKSIQYSFLAFFSLALVAVALTLQFVGYQDVLFAPCPLCILQRLGYIGVALSCILAAAFKSIAKWFHALAFLFATYGLAVAIRHVWLLSHPESSCGIDPLETWINQFQLTNYFSWIFKADGFCTAKLPTIFGLQVPEWSLVWFSLFWIVLLVTFFRRVKHPHSL